MPLYPFKVWELLTAAGAKVYDVADEDGEFRDCRAIVIDDDYGILDDESSCDYTDVLDEYVLRSRDDEGRDLTISEIWTILVDAGAEVLEISDCSGQYKGCWAIPLDGDRYGLANSWQGGYHITNDLDEVKSRPSQPW